MGSHKRIHLFISGRVQGVFFRMETQRAAKQIGVTGWVKNMRDGRVEAVIEGPAENVAEMAQWCHKGPAMAWVTDVAVHEEDYSGEFKDFFVTY